MATAHPWARAPEPPRPRPVPAPAPALRRPPAPAPTGAPSTGPLDLPRGLRLWKNPRVIADLWWVGAHGGAGETTLAATLRRSAATGHRWPDPGPIGPPAPVVLLARTSVTGLEAAQAALAQWDAGLAGRVDLLGLVLSADAPGRKLPPELAGFIDLVAAAPVRVWTLPWIAEWRLWSGRDGTRPPAPRPVTALLEAVTDLLYPRRPTP